MENDPLIRPSLGSQKYGTINDAPDDIETAAPTNEHNTKRLSMWGLVFLTFFAGNLLVNSILVLFITVFNLMPRIVNFDFIFKINGNCDTSLTLFVVSGGPYGIEDAVRIGYPFYALLGMVIIPWIWSLPR